MKRARHFIVLRGFRPEAGPVPDQHRVRQWLVDEAEPSTGLIQPDLFVGLSEARPCLALGG
jgi:hypothetical protein